MSLTWMVFFSCLIAFGFAKSVTVIGLYSTFEKGITEFRTVDIENLTAALLNGGYRNVIDKNISREFSQVILDKGSKSSDEVSSETNTARDSVMRQDSDIADSAVRQEAARTSVTNSNIERYCTAFVTQTGSDIPCLCMTASMSVQFKYTNNNGEKASFTMKVPVDMENSKVRGSCMENNTYITFLWNSLDEKTPGPQEKLQNEMTIHFSKNVSHYYMNAMSFILNNNDKNSTRRSFYIRAVNDSLMLFPTALGDEVYVCRWKRNIPVENIVVTVHNLKFFAFNNATIQRNEAACINEARSLTINIIFECLVLATMCLRAIIYMIELWIKKSTRYYFAS